MVGACLPGAKINCIGAIDAHTVFSEDGILNGALRGVTPVDFTGGWADKCPRPPQPACCASRATVPRPSHRSQYSGTNRPSCARRRGRPRHLGQIVRPGPGPLFARFPLSLMPPSVAPTAASAESHVAPFGRHKGRVPECGADALDRTLRLDSSATTRGRAQPPTRPCPRSAPGRPRRGTRRSP
jgi:hypothetical protein